MFVFSMFFSNFQLYVCGVRCLFLEIFVIYVYVILYICNGAFKVDVFNPVGLESFAE